MSEVIVCPCCKEEQEYQGGWKHNKVFFSEGKRSLECYHCGEVFSVTTETIYVYEVEAMDAWILLDEDEYKEVAE